MRAVVQRVKYGAVEIEGHKVREIGKGLVIFLAIGEEDFITDISYISDKIANLRVFEDESGKMSKSPIEVNAPLLVIPNFTLYGDVRRGRRPDFVGAAKPDVAKPVYEKFVALLKGYNLAVVSGEFGKIMNVIIHNDGPVTILLDSKKTF